ncbi:MAG: prepilin-type N-terminal cleavage/methylation domain-containing protein [Fimbriimonadaceae bacterium]
MSIVGKKGFTLTEILVAVAIVLVVAALLFPVFRFARQRALASACGQNLSQVGKAVQMYAADHSGFAPPFVVRSHDFQVPGYEGSEPEKWRSSLASYLGDNRVFVCRGDPIDPDNPGARSWDTRQNKAHAWTSFTTYRIFDDERSWPDRRYRLSLQRDPPSVLYAFTRPREVPVNEDPVGMFGSKHHRLYLDGSVDFVDQFHIEEDREDWSRN